MSSSNRSWLADEKLPDEVVHARFDRLSTQTKDKKEETEINLRIQFRVNTPEDRCLELLRAALPTLAGTIEKVHQVTSNADYALSPIITVRIVRVEA